LYKRLFWFASLWIAGALCVGVLATPIRVFVKI
jgi:hypothetical protein